MIKHCFTQSNQGQEEDFQFETFQKENTGSLIRDSLIFTPSLKNSQKMRQSSRIIRNINKEGTIESQQLRTVLMSTNRRNKMFDTVKQETQMGQKNPLSQYMVNPFDIKMLKKLELSEGFTKNQSKIKKCCLDLQQAYKKKLKFMTGNNQQLYEESSILRKEKDDLVLYTNKLKQQIKSLKDHNMELKKQNFKIMSYCQTLIQQYKKRQALKLIQTKNNIQEHQQEIKILQQISQLLDKNNKQSENEAKSKNDLAFSRSNNTKVQNREIKRSKTEYFYAQKQESPQRLQRSSSKPDNRNTLARQTKIEKQMEQRLTQISQKRKQKIVIQTLNTKLPSTILQKMGKGKVGKLVQAKSTLVKSNSIYTKMVPSCLSQRLKK